MTGHVLNYFNKPVIMNHVKSFRVFISFCIVVFSALFIVTSLSAQAQTSSATSKTSTEKAKEEINFAFHFLTILRQADLEETTASMQIIQENWNKSLLPLALETVSYGSSSPHRAELVALIQQEAGSLVGFTTRDWYRWLWNTKNFTADPSYNLFKSLLYRSIDSRFEAYFRNREEQTRIRLDEVQWGGVVQDGIPPLRNPEMISASEATYLGDDNIVFGIEVNGDARAYPKRILAWHEMFTDTIGGVDIAGVYCTLCGTVIPFKTNFNGQKFDLGTSGFLYRSNKLMYDQATQSLWSTTRGTPVIGPLVDKGIQLEYEAVVTTTWGEWKKRNPKTKVLSLNTGHRRDYGEGSAYNEYFSTDTLMFRTPFEDKRLKNKQEILALRFPAAPNQQLAIDTDFLNKNPLYKNRIGAQQFLVLTDKSGANRVFDPQGIQFTSYDGDSTAVDSNGQKWTVNESNLVAANGRDKLGRLPYHRAFWFGWRAAFPETQLIK